ncbi:MAG: pimeloyl-ACP methyl ester carboxylesterase [Alphaproteobacteria bacterium]|jgi:pimeloyl-ACP methyl ester carboxylesterase
MTLNIDRIGSFHLGGAPVTVSGLPVESLILTPGADVRPIDQNGDHEIGQMYVQYVRLDQPSGRYPLLMWHGGGMTGVTWEDTPDGRAGWQSAFLQAGFDVYVSDAVERGRASWTVLPGVYEGDPVARSKLANWQGFRIGPVGSYDSAASGRKTFDGQQFPVEAYDQFAKQVVPRWLHNDDRTQAAYDALIQRCGSESGGAIVMTHSQGGHFGFTAARMAPDTVKALVSIEPSGAPDPAMFDIAAIRDVPQLIVWGDFIHQSEPRWPEYQRRTRAFADAINTAGGHVDIYDLPAMGITGNSHFPMMDRNSDVVAALVDEWLAARGLKNN